jgi:hypothetical protein
MRELTVEKTPYVIRVTHGSNWTAIFHPADYAAAAALRIGKSHTFTDEQGKRWEVKCIGLNQGQWDYELRGIGNNYKGKLIL